MNKLFAITILFFCIHFSIVCQGQSETFTSTDGRLRFDIVLDQKHFFILLTRSAGCVQSVHTLSSGQVVRENEKVLLVDLEQNFVHTFRSLEDTLVGVNTFEFLKAVELKKDQYYQLQIAELTEIHRKGAVEFELPQELQPIQNYFDSLASNRIPSDTSSYMGAWGSTLPPGKGDNFWIEFSPAHYKLYYFDIVLFTGRYYRLDETIFLETGIGGIMSFTVDRFTLVPLKTLKWLNLRFFKV